MSVAYELPPRVRRVRPQAPAIVLPFSRPESLARDRVDVAVVSASPAESAPAVDRPTVDVPRAAAPVELASAATADLVHPPIDVVRAPIERPGAFVYVPGGPVVCPASSPARSRSVRDLERTDARGGRVRLTARGRRLRALVCACALVVAGWITVSAVRAAVSSPVIPSSAPAIVKVHPGDTLWSIAAQVAPRQDPRRVVEALRSANHLTSNTVRPGQQLHVPH